MASPQGSITLSGNLRQSSYWFMLKMATAAPATLDAVGSNGFENPLYVVQPGATIEVMQ